MKDVACFVYAFRMLLKEVVCVCDRAFVGHYERLDIVWNLSLNIYMTWVH